MNITSTAPLGPPASGAPPTGRPSLDQIIWMGIGSNPGNMLGWSAIGSAAVMLALAKILSDTVKYYDHYGYKNIKMALAISLGTLVACVHAGITCAQTFQLGRFAYSGYASIAGFDNYANTTSNLIGGLFNFAAACYYTNQVLRLSNRKLWLLIIIMTLNTGTLVLTIAVAVVGYRIPPPQMANMARYRELNVGRVPYFKAWGVFALFGDIAICGTMTYYLLRIKDSIVHKQKKLVYKLQTLVLGTMLPPVVMTLILAVSQKSGTSNIGDYRRVVKYILPIFYYLSPLHSIITHIHLRTEIRDRDDDTTNPDSIPLSPHESQWKGQQSTMHIDPHRDKNTPLRYSEEKVVGQPVSILKEIPCKRTFGAEEPAFEPIQPAYEKSMKWKSKKEDTKQVQSSDYGSQKPSKRTFGDVDTIIEQEDSNDGHDCRESALGLVASRHPSAGEAVEMKDEDEVWSPDHVERKGAGVM